MPEPIRIFISYAHKDETFRQKLEVRLKSIGRVVSIEYWSDPKILAGARFEDDIFKQLETADVVILLISPDFMASDYCFSIEMGKALKKYEETGRGVPVPIVVRPEPTWTHHKIGQHQALPKHATAISKWNDEDDAWESVSEGLLALLRDIESRRP